jgi:hypothetical protein
MRFFFFGLLSDRDVLELVLGRAGPSGPFPRASLAGYRLVGLCNETYPALVPDPGSGVEGILVEGLSEADVERIQFFESVEYEATMLEVTRADGTRVEARVFAGSGRVEPDDDEWSLEDWRARHKAKDLREAALWMALYGRLSAEEADRRWDQALAEGRSIEDLVAEVCADPVAART